MIVDDLYNKVLINPINEGSDNLYIVAGFASPAIVYRHLHTNGDFKVNLIIGMVQQSGIGLGAHNTFKQLVTTDFPGRFYCKYLISDVPAHLKLYGWYSGNNPRIGYLGSANYSQTAFSSRQLEAMIECDASPIKSIFDSLVTSAMDCCDDQVTNLISFIDEKRIIKRKEYKDGTTESPDDFAGDDLAIRGFNPSVKLSFISRTGETGTRSGINWGQRPHRNPNQAYLLVTAEIARSRFFPPAKQPFVIHTDDNRHLDCVVAQQNDKGVETYRNNSIMGAYIRERIGVPSGSYVNRSDFVNYGRTDVDIFKIDEENYYMDFSVTHT